MPHWVVLLVITVAAWLAGTVIGGFVIGRVLAAIERRHASAGTEALEEHDLRKAA